jgi:hypothetical protein
MQWVEQPRHNTNHLPPCTAGIYAAASPPQEGCHISQWDVVSNPLKLKMCLIKHYAEKMYRDAHVQLLPFLTLVPAGGQCLNYMPQMIQHNLKYNETCL